MVALLGLLFASCSNNEGLKPNNKRSETHELLLATSLENYTRATDTAFETGDRVGLFLLLPDAYLEADPNTKKAHLDNAALAVQADGSLKVDQDLNADGLMNDEDRLLWHADERYAADLVAYYPYNSEWEYSYRIGEVMTFCVQADQTSWANYTASDLMAAHLQSAPTEEQLILPFRHLLSKVVITVENQLGEAIENLWFADVYGEVKYDLREPQQVETSGLKGMIRAYAETTRAEESFRLILAPSANLRPRLIVTTASQKQYTFDLAQAVTFSSGKQYTARITLDSASSSTEFTPEIGDWNEDEQFVFVPRDSKWSLIGNFPASGGWAADVMMTEIEEGVFTASTEFVGETEFKVRYNNSWDVNRGMKTQESVKFGVRYDVVNQGPNFVVNHEGVCRVTYDANTEQIWVTAL